MSAPDCASRRKPTTANAAAAIKTPHHGTSPRSLGRGGRTQGWHRIEALFGGRGRVKPAERFAHHDRSLASEHRMMRAVPIIATGVGGTMLGTDPLGEMLRSERKRKRRPR